MNNIQKISSTVLELNKIYHFNLGDMSHCGMSHNDMIEHYKSNKSPLSFLMERLLIKWFKNLKSDTKRKVIKYGNNDEKQIKICPDGIFTDLDILYDQKGFDHKGGDFSRSSMKGVGRSVNDEENQIWIKNQIFIWTDFCELPKIRVIALSGEECIKRFPKSKITFKEKDDLFKE